MAELMPEGEWSPSIEETFTETDIAAFEYEQEQRANQTEIQKGRNDMANSEWGKTQNTQEQAQQTAPQQGGWGQQQTQAQPQQQSGWGQSQQAQQQEESMAYIDKATREAMKTDPVIADKANKMLEVAKQIGEKIKEQGLTTTSKVKKGDRAGETYTNKLVVSVPTAVKWNKETQQEEQLQHNDGSPVLAPQIAHKIGSATITLHAKENTENGVNISSVTAQRFDREQNRMQYAKGSEIQSGSWSQPVKKVAALMEGFVQQQEYAHTPLSDFAVEMNKALTANGEKILTDDGQAKNEVYAQYKADEGYGEKVQVRSHQEKNIVIELGTTAEGKPYAKATNFDVQLDDGKFASFYINNPDDLKRPELATVPNDAKIVVSEYMERFSKEQSKTAEQPKKKAPQAERD